jgi:hypothetical protein
LFLPINFGASEFTIPSDAAGQLDYEQAFQGELIARENFERVGFPPPQQHEGISKINTRRPGFMRDN